MSCGVSEQQLRLWVAGNAPELEPHLAACPDCKQLAAQVRAEFRGDRAPACGVSEEQLWLWIDDGAQELDLHVAWCERCREVADGIRASIKHVVEGSIPPEVPLPEAIGPYKVVRLIGDGAQGLIYEAEQETPRRHVAIKVLRGGRYVGLHDLRHFQNEIRSLARLNHPGIAAIYDGGRTEAGEFYYVMEFVGGLALDAHVSERNVLREGRLELFCKVCDAVRHAHEHNVIHRDLKPGNILVAVNGQPKILDFGLARITDCDVSLTSMPTASGQPVGTLQYMSPEQALGQTRQIDCRSDVYALGVILYELLAGRPPYDVGQDVLQGVKAIIEAQPKSLSRIDRSVSRGLEAVAFKAVEKEPARRYQSVAKLGEDVRRYLAGEQPLARPSGRLHATFGALRRHRIAVGVTIAIVVLGLFGVWAGTWWRDWSLARQHAERLRGGRYAILDCQRQLEAGRTEFVLDQARTYFERFPELSEARLLYAQAQFRKGRESGIPEFTSTAISLLSDPRTDDPYAWASAALLADIYRVLGRATEADALLARAESEMPDAARDWYVRSFATLDVGRALQYAERAEGRAPGEDLVPLIWNRLAHLRLRNADYDGALAAADTLVALGNSVPTWLEFGGNVLMWQGHYRRAIERFARAASATGDSKAFRFEAVAHLCLREYREAEEDYSRAVEHEKSSMPWNRYMRATPRWILGRLDDAAADYRRFRELFRGPSYASARLFIVLQDRARQLDGHGHATEAGAAREEADAVLNAGIHEAAAGSWLRKIHECLAGAITGRQLTEAAKKPAEVCEGCYYAGEAARLQGHRDEARAWFQRCADLSLPIDPHTTDPDPMNEYHLAVWRLEQLRAGATSSGPAAGP